MSRTSRKTRSRRAEPRWASYDDDRLLDVRFSELGVQIDGTELEPRVGRLYQELENRRIGFQPHVWLSNEWFSPDAYPGIAIPFYLAHPRLKALERAQMLEVEGGTRTWCLRILRHEAGHAVDTAFDLHRRPEYRQLFGSWSSPYPKFYQPKPYSKSYVQHLDAWYAQAHPAEDFAETFAVWLRPGSNWRQRYADWPAIRKLEYVDELMRSLRREKPVNARRKQLFPLRELKKTLREHYREKKAHYARTRPDFYDRDLRKLFSDDPADRRNETAASFIRSIKPDLRKLVARWTGEHHYTIDRVLDDIILRCRELKLRLARSPRRTRLDAVTMITVQTMNYLHDGHHRVAL